MKTDGHRSSKSPTARVAPSGPTQIAREVGEATGLDTRTTDFAALFRGEAISHAELQAIVEAAMPSDWREHFHEPM